MNLGIKYFLTILPLSKRFVHVFIALAANKVLIGAKINTHKLIKTASKPRDMTSIGNTTF